MNRLVPIILLTAAAGLAPCQARNAAASESSAAGSDSVLLEQNSPPDSDPHGTVRVVGAETDVAKRYSFIVPPLPFPPFSSWRKWWKDHELAVHCALEWKNDQGIWHYAELRNAKWDKGDTKHRVGLGEFPCTGYIAYNIYIFEGRVPRVADRLGRPMLIVYDEVIKCDYKCVEFQVRNYAAFGKSSCDPGTGNYGRENCGMGGPAYKPAQNSNTMINYILCKCGVKLPAPDRATGWDTVPIFPYSSNSHFPKYANQL